MSPAQVPIVIRCHECHYGQRVLDQQRARRRDVVGELERGRLSPTPGLPLKALEAPLVNDNGGAIRLVGVNAFGHEGPLGAQR